MRSTSSVSSNRRNSRNNSSRSIACLPGVRPVPGALDRLHELVDIHHLDLDGVTCAIESDARKMMPVTVGLHAAGDG
jgi:hypothetical protein